jgi:restriction endonuclease
MEYYPSQDTYVYTVNKDNKVNLDFSSNALKTEYAKMFKQKYDELLKELKASSEYQQATATTKVTLEKETKTKARTATTNDMKKIVYERTKG